MPLPGLTASNASAILAEASGMASNASLTERLQLFMRGDSTVVDALLEEVLPKLHEIATRELKREQYMAPLSKTELIHEVWLSGLSEGGWEIRDQGHFYALDQSGDAARSHRTPMRSRFPRRCATSTTSASTDRRRPTGRGRDQAGTRVSAQGGLLRAD